MRTKGTGTRGGSKGGKHQESAEALVEGWRARDNGVILEVLNLNLPTLGMPNSKGGHVQQPAAP